MRSHLLHGCIKLPATLGSFVAEADDICWRVRVDSRQDSGIFPVQLGLVKVQLVGGPHPLHNLCARSRRGQHRLAVHTGSRSYNARLSASFGASCASCFLPCEPAARRHIPNAEGAAGRACSVGESVGQGTFAPPFEGAPTLLGCTRDMCCTRTRTLCPSPVRNEIGCPPGMGINLYAVRTRAADFCNPYIRSCRV